jgi:predicted Zn-dependent protease
MGEPASAAKALVAASLLAVLLSSCALSGPAVQRGTASPQANPHASPIGELAVWKLHDLAHADQPAILLRDSAGIYGVVDTKLLQGVLAIAERMNEAAGVAPTPEWIVVGSRSVNAFAFFNEAQPTIAVTLGMIGLLAADDAAWAALLGHELAHLRLDHLKRMKSRRDTAEVTSSVAGLILSAIGLPLGSVVADATTALADRAYSRDDEREADRMGFDYMRRAGFAPQGAISLHQLLLGTRDSRSMPFLSTHPSGEERIENLQELIRSGN